MVIAINRWVVELNFEIHTEAVKWNKFSPLIAIFNAYRFLDTDEAFWCIECLNTRLLQQVNKRTRTAIHNWNFGCIHFDNRIVDPHPC
ncbi:Uncharacterised protein [Vibrio cholerae]|uniref:Uncharacterized protein n=1 Tax=Vibrio cholerae TaxID=666 RepID=A0A655W4S3_VIBCL|nr:Uncharacterised protein [Vibrio cholerae]CSB83005.1 Uncharacterised protein [Vibrio cholerae]